MPELDPLPMPDPLAAPAKFETLVGMTAQYRGEPQWTGMIHEVNGDYALVQYDNGIWQLVPMEKVNQCILVPPKAV